MVFEGDSLKDYILDFKDNKLVKVELPSVEECECKVGKWIEERDDYGELTAWHCSNCYDETGFSTTCAWDYCPSCGSRNKR